jgi:hypothetical protein
MGESFYKYTDEYRERFAINQGERYWIEEAFKLYVKTAKEELGDDSIITAPYIEQLFKDISNKLNCWTD